MNKQICFVASTILLLACNTKNDMLWFDNAVETAHSQLTQMALSTENAPETRCFPRSIKNDQVRLEDIYDWTSGFFPGNLWLGYELTGDENLAQEARKYTDRLSDLQYFEHTHDLGFMVFCSYGQAARLKIEKNDIQTITNAAESLAKRFSPITQSIRSWDFGKWSYPVIIDNMMNLELLFEAAKYSGNDKFKQIAITHANTTLRNHYRSDYTSFHVVSYQPTDGSIESKGTFQGYSDESAWARGQAWGLYGFTMCYRYTQDPAYLAQAQHIADFIMKNRPAENDYIPYWDYNAPDIPNAPRDASAAAITASCLLELQAYTQNGKTYFEYAEQILKQLSSDEYLAKVGENCHFILKHSVGHWPANSEIDTPLNYADYYYLEALLRYKSIICN